MEKKQLQKIKQISPKTVLGFLLAAFIAFLFLIAVINISKKYFSIRSGIKELKDQESQLKFKYEKLESFNNYFSTPSGQEKALREKFNVVKPGEGIIVINSEENNLDIVKNKSPILKFWDLILRGIGIK